MRYCFFTLLIISLSVSVYSQKLNSFLTLQAGMSVPLFDFASTNLDKGSFALSGFSGSGEFEVKLSNHLGAFLQSGVQLNPIDVGTLGYEKIQADPFLQDVYIRSDPFKYIHLLAGPEYYYQLTNSLILSGQIGAGVMASFTPYQLYKPEYFMTGPPFFEITTARDVSFAYGAGLHLTYKIKSCYSIGVYTQFIGSQAAYEFWTGSRTRIDKRYISTWNSLFTFTIQL